jgi:hypothetical protein
MEMLQRAGQAPWSKKQSKEIPKRRHKVVFIAQVSVPPIDCLSWNRNGLRASSTDLDRFL